MARIPRVRGAVALAVRHKVVGQLDGVHPSLHVGRSLDFNDLREYAAGDDVADIDWRATARTGELLIRRHVAERRSALLVALTTGVQLAGLAAPGVRKRDLALDAAATLAVLAHAFGDHAGLLWCDDGSPRAARPTTRLVDLERQLTAAEATVSPDAAPTDLDRLLGTAARTLRRRGVVAVISDDVLLDPQLESRVRRLGAQHTVLWLTVPDADPTDPRLGGPLLDLERGARLPDWLYDERLRRDLADERARRATLRANALMRLGVAHAELGDPATVVADVVSLVRRLRHVR
ncbi:DUF58 domain-containing protein [Tessaracoccus palaemonis]|uniref:DUF58 domain-containing protein n=1 Tax=Tessaracoccus palaemonis TaxID=2829499 RepID=A0ABX8SJZ7_9ACTN|nr:DUF58 domain-containing protein [Tessaracoccus palaemonis]QXT63605.1 DUF58 domain-containing protein [Tessaracoccus palaemonis]